MADLIHPTCNVNIHMALITHSDGVKCSVAAFNFYTGKLFIK